MSIRLLQNCWTAKRAVEGITIHFKDPLNCAPVVEPPRKKMKIADDSQGLGVAAVASELSALEQAPAIAAAGVGGGEKGEAGAANGEAGPKDVETTTPLASGEWSGSISFIEWRGEVALHVVGYTPIVMVGVQARRLALVAMRKAVAADSTVPAAADPQEEEKFFNEFVSWVSPEGHKPISPQLHFARDHSVCSVFPVKSDLGMRQEYSLTTKEISGGLRLASFPIPVRSLACATNEL